MPPETYYSRRADNLYRLYRKAGGGLVAEEWVENAWHGMGDADFVIFRTTPISSGAAATFMAMRHRPGSPAAGAS